MSYIVRYITLGEPDSSSEPTNLFCRWRRTRSNNHRADTRSVSENSITNDIVHSYAKTAIRYPTIFVHSHSTHVTHTLQCDGWWFVYVTLVCPVAVSFIAISVTTFGVMIGEDRTWMPRFDINRLSWSFGLAVVSGFFAAFACMSISTYAVQRRYELEVKQDFAPGRPKMMPMVPKVWRRQRYNSIGGARRWCCTVCRDKGMRNVIPSSIRCWILHISCERVLVRRVCAFVTVNAEFRQHQY